MRIEIEPVKKDQGYVCPCDEEEATGYGVYFDDELYEDFETKAEAKKWIASYLLETADTSTR